MVYRLIARDTIEERVMALQARKNALFANVMDGGDMFSGGLDADDIRALFEWDLSSGAGRSVRVGSMSSARRAPGRCPRSASVAMSW